MQKQLIGGKAYGYKQQVKHIDRNSICIMDVYYLHFQYYHAGIEWGTLCSGNHYLCECVYYFFMLLLAAFTEHQKNGGQREVFKMDTFLPDCWYCCIYSCRVYCFTCIERNWNGMKRQNTRRKCSHIRWKDVCLGLSIYKMNVMVNNKNLSKYGEYHGKRTNAY